MLKLFSVALVTATLLALTIPSKKLQTSPAAITSQKLLSFDCAPDYNPFNAENKIGPLKGWGNYQWKINTTSDSAQFYFNQGINMYYAFHIIEARASFARVTELDPNSAIGWWALALSYGPNINDFVYNETPDALSAINKAMELQPTKEKDKALIHAMSLRYSKDTSQSREALNQAYAAAMKQAMKDLPNDADIAALYADALMLLHPWDLYDHDFNPKPWTPEIVQVIEKALKLNPRNPGANHYYIHAVEASSNPGRALASADRLPGLMPQVAHLVHMPSHIYIRTGNYQKGAKVNEDAIKGFENYLQAFPDVAGNAPLYSIHNLHMEATCNMMAGNYAKSKVSALKAQQSVPADFLAIPGPVGHYVQYVYATPLFAMIRFEKWNEILQTDVPDSLPYANILWHFARGLAYSKTGKLSEARGELGGMQERMAAHASLKEPFTPFNSAYTACRIAEALLAGTIAQEEGDLFNAIDQFKYAVKVEDGMVYNEPKDWLLPARHYLGNALLKDKQYAEAKKVYKKDLQINPANGWSLKGLQQSRNELNKTKR